MLRHAVVDESGMKKEILCVACIYISNQLTHFRTWRGSRILCCPRFFERVEGVHMNSFAILEDIYDFYFNALYLCLDSRN